MNLGAHFLSTADERFQLRLFQVSENVIELSIQSIQVNVREIILSVRQNVRHFYPHIRFVNEGIE